MKICQSKSSVKTHLPYFDDGMFAELFDKKYLLPTIKTITILSSLDKGVCLTFVQKIFLFLLITLIKMVSSWLSSIT